MQRRNWAGNCGIGIFVLAFVTTIVAFCSPGWLVSDYRILHAKLDQLGLWTHCFRNLPEPIDEYHHRFFVGCRWIYNPFTTGYDQLRGYLLPPFLIATQVLFTLMLIAVLGNLILVLVFFLCSNPKQRHFIPLLKGIACLLLFGGVSGLVAVIVFGSLSDRENWMSGRPYHYFGWGFALAVVAVILTFMAAALFLFESRVQTNKQEKELKMEPSTDLSGGMKS